MKKIILTGGGTAGHVTPNIALIPALQKLNFQIEYIGSFSGIEKELITAQNINYYGISSGKLRRYLDFKNFTDIFRVAQGFSDAKKILKKVSPELVFSKGGFVSVPVVIAAKMLNIPVIIHESDITPGLANKIAIPFATYVCASFPETLNHLPKEKAVLTGSPIRKSLFDGSPEKGKSLCGFKNSKPILLIMGGSLGSVKINNCVRSCLAKLLKDFNIVHICGKGNLDTQINSEGYLQFEYVSKELPHIFACADLIVSRAGSNSIYEFLALRKPNLLIPLSKNASRGDQILNAESFERQGFSKVLFEEDMTEETIYKNIIDLYENKGVYVATMSASNLSSGVEEIIGLITQKK